MLTSSRVIKANTCTCHVAIVFHGDGSHRLVRTPRVRAPSNLPLAAGTRGAPRTSSTNTMSSGICYAPRPPSRGATTAVRSWTPGCACAAITYAVLPMQMKTLRCRRTRSLCLESNRAPFRRLSAASDSLSMVLCCCPWSTRMWRAVSAPRHGIQGRPRAHVHAGRRRAPCGGGTPRNACWVHMPAPAAVQASWLSWANASGVAFFL